MDCQSGNADETGNLIGAVGTSESIQTFPKNCSTESKSCEYINMDIIAWNKCSIIWSNCISDGNEKSKQKTNEI